MFLILIQEFQALNFVCIYLKAGKDQLGPSSLSKDFDWRAFLTSRKKSAELRTERFLHLLARVVTGINGVRNGGEEEVRVQSLPAL